MFTKVQNILAKQLRVDEASITMDSKIKEDLGADSLSILELLMTLEEDEGIKIPDEKLATFTVVGDIVRYLDSLQ